MRLRKFDRTISFTMKVINRKILYHICAVLSICILGCNPPKKNQPKEELKTGSKATEYFDTKTLNGWEVTNFGPQGPVYVSGGSIILGMGDGCTGITWAKDFPKVNYEVHLEAKQMDGNDFFCGMTFPVKEDFCTLIVGGWTGSVTGLSNIDGYDASENETTLFKLYEKNVWYNIKLRVTADSIIAWVDDTTVVDVNIVGKKLSIRPEVTLSKPFGIASWQTTAAIRNIDVTQIDQ